MSTKPEPISRTYRFAMSACAPIVRWWGRLDARGVDHLPTSGPTLVIGNHDSYWDPVAIGIAGRKRRQIRALAKDTLWNVPGLAPILNGMGQVPIKRGAGDAQALETAIAHLRGGACIGVFPEGTTSRGRTLRARSGVGRLAKAVPETTIVLCTVKGTVDIARFPARPRIEVEFFPPAAGPCREDETASEFAVRALAEIRERAPIVSSGRKRKREAQERRARELAAQAERDAARGDTASAERHVQDAVDAQSTVEDERGS
jgi:1-acyl-sn-glycerol-3-phosphate acyltransferase